MWLTRRAAAPWSTRGEREPECDRAWTSCLGVSFVLKESQLLAERSRNHTDRPMDGASVSQGRVLQCSFHPLFPSLSRCCSQLLFLSRHPSRHPTTFSLFLSLSVFLSFIHAALIPLPPRARTSILRDSPSASASIFPSLFALLVLLFKCHLADD